ncbi:MAG: phosphohistidine phosphatase SixA [Mariprofundaceae bacterium]|nr:phosphohistidine phosphatase SixA [Mariprofundaceae bacterium]
MRLYLVQHAAATSKEEGSTRPLTPQGREDIVRTGGFLSLFERPKPTHIIHSDKLRSQQTAQMLAEAWGCQGIEKNLDLSPRSDPNIWAKRLIEIHEDTLLVGHLPHLQHLAAILLCQNAKRKVIQFRNAGITCLEREENNWSLIWQVYPQLFYPQD